MNIRNKNVEAPFQLLRTWISVLQFENNCIECNPGANGQREIDVSYQIIETDKDDDGDLIAHLMLQVEINTETDDGLFHLLLQLNGIFMGIVDHLDSARFSEMLRLNGCSSLYSIARAQISCITSQAFSGGNVLIPLVNFINFRAAEEEPESEVRKSD